MCSGISLYATVLAAGLALRWGLVPEVAQLESLEVLAHPYVLGAAGVAFFFEFFADKTMFVDSLWDSAHTFIRPVGAAVLGAVAAGSDHTALQAAMFLLCGTVALSSHTAKASMRVAVNHSPEPVSNIMVSFLENILSMALVWLSLTSPFLVLFVVLVFFGFFIWLFPKIVRLIGKRLRRIAAMFRRPGAPDPGGA